jgi:hypothetical protein
MGGWLSVEFDMLYLSFLGVLNIQSQDSKLNNKHERSKYVIITKTSFLNNVHVKVQICLN